MSITYNIQHHDRAQSEYLKVNIPTSCGNAIKPGTSISSHKFKCQQSPLLATFRMHSPAILDYIYFTRTTQTICSNVLPSYLCRVHCRCRQQPFCFCHYKGFCMLDFGACGFINGISMKYLFLCHALLLVSNLTHMLRMCNKMPNHRDNSFIEI